MPRRFFQVTTGLAFWCSAGERDLARHGVVKRATKRINITGACDLSWRANLLRRKIISRSNNLSSSRVTGVVEVISQTKIRKLGDAIGRYQNVTRFDVTVDQITLMGVR